MEQVQQNQAAEKRIVWNTERAEEAKLKISQGYRLRDHPFWQGNVSWRKENITYEYTREELKEIDKCKNDILYFADQYAYSMTEQGLANIKLRDYQKELLLCYKEKRFSVILASRQSGKTISAAIFLAWYVSFHFDKNVLIVANKGKTVNEIIGKTKEVLRHLPFFLKTGVITNNQGSMAFDNGSRIIGETASKNPAIGFTIHLIYADEFAHIDENIVESYYKSIYPTLSASNFGKMIITSTPNGFNKFHNIYANAVEGDNEFTPIRIDWWQVPGRDEKWAQAEIDNLGSVEAFNQEYGNSFDSASSILFYPHQIKQISKTLRPYVHHEFDILDAWGCDYENLTWDQKFDIEELRNENKYFFIGVDASEGLGLKSDYTVLTFFQLIPMPSIYLQQLKSPTKVSEFFALKQVGLFRDNSQSPAEIAKLLYLMMYRIMNEDNVKASIEFNNYGREIISHLPVTCEPINEFGEESVVHFFHQINAKYKLPGIKLHGFNRDNYIANAQKKHEEGRLFVTAKTAFSEIQTFGKKGKKWQAQIGKDDVIMSIFTAAAAIDTTEFEEFTEFYFDTLPDKKKQEILKKLEKTPEKNVDSETLTVADVYDFFDTEPK